jgi:hypothetical protein
MGDTTGAETGAQRRYRSRTARTSKKTIDLEGRIVKNAVRKTLQDRQKAISDLIDAIREYRKLADRPLTLRGSEYAHAVLELNKAIDRADGLLK